MFVVYSPASARERSVASAAVFSCINDVLGAGVDHGVNDDVIDEYDPPTDMSMNCTTDADTSLPVSAALSSRLGLLNYL